MGQYCFTFPTHRGTWRFDKEVVIINIDLLTIQILQFKTNWIFVIDKSSGAPLYDGNFFQNMT